MPIKLLIAYNVRPARVEAYYRFMMGEFLPTAQNIGLHTVEVWHTLWGDYPQRLIELAADSQQTMQQILVDERWREMETELKQYVNDYQRQVVPYRNGFQFLRPD